MATKLIFGFVIFHLMMFVFTDIYMHNPRGSNNRLNERRATRQTNNRVFDSQNNNRGGYNVGVNTPNSDGRTAGQQYQMLYFQSSDKAKSGAQTQGVSNLLVEWTNQHGCGGNEDDNPNKMNCQLILQYMCQPSDQFAANSIDKLRDGTSTQRNEYQQPQYRETKSNFNGRKRNSNRQAKALQEPLEWYDKCTKRERNKSLFTADQKLRGKAAKYTRQNPNGNRNGYECPEERDYYPYWHPTDWKDIGILAENQSMCEYFRKESFNVKSKWECVENFTQPNEPKHYSVHNNNESCVEAGGQWLEFHNFLEKATQFTSKNTCHDQNNVNANKQAKIQYIWARPIYKINEECLVALDKPKCSASPFSRDNHLGNGVDLEPLTMNWTIPFFPSKAQQTCVLRMRYNISTDDYDPYNTTAAQNQNPQEGVQSPVQQNPAVDIGADNTPLQLAINTAQYGRTFQDRSHVFLLEPRPNTVASAANIHNLNVRGKRGNIVQVYPAVEYYFVPTNLKMKPDDLVHMQWTGSNTHNNQLPGGDGQTGDDGQGKKGTDRSNILGLKNRLDNYPAPMEDASSIFNDVKSVKWSSLDGIAANKLKAADIAVQHASSGYYACVKNADCDNQSVEKKTQMNNLLNNTSPSYRGMLLQMNAGEYHYMCTRNNNFSNRSQKGSLIVK